MISGSTQLGDAVGTYLCWPEEEHDKEIATGDKSDDQDENHGALVLLEESRRSHRKWRIFLW